MEEEKKSTEAKLEKLSATVTRLTIDSFENNYSQVYSQSVDYQPEYSLVLDLDDKKDYEFMKSMRNFPLPILRKMAIAKAEESDDELKSFFIHSTPAKLRYFSFNFSVKTWIDLQAYLDGITYVLKSTQEEVYFNYCKFDSECLSEVIKSSIRCKSIILKYCEILTDDECDFKTEEASNVELLSFGYGLGQDICKWVDNPQRFENIVKAIKDSKLKTTLKQVSVDSCTKSENLV